MKRIVSIFVLLTMSLSLLCGCFLIEKPDDSGDQGGIADGENDGSGNNENPDNNDQGNNANPDDNEGEKPIEPDPDAGKCGIDEILLAFSELKTGESEFEDTMVNATVKSYTFNKLDENNSANPVAVYVIGHGERRVGTDSDVSIIRDLIEEYTVVVLDYQGASGAVSPALEESAHALKLEMTTSGRFLDGINYNAKKTYLIPAGCRIVRDVEFFNVMENAPKGVEQKIIDVWNNQTQVKTKVGDAWVEADSLDDIVMKNGESLTAKDAEGNYKHLSYRLDIIYPANAEQSAPVIISAAPNTIRSDAITSKEGRYQYAGFLFGGYAFSMVDHDYFPFMNGQDGWGHIEPNYTLQTYMGTRFMTAAVRCTKYFADEYGYSTEKYGIYGFSKSSWVALFKQSSIANADPELLEEIYTYGGFEAGECFGEQPYKTYKNGQKISSGVTCLYHGMGNGTNDCRYLDESNIPQLVGVGEKCQYNSWSKFFTDPNVLLKMDESGCNWVPLMMYGVGHTYPPDMQDKLYGYNYYEAFRSFFDYHLKGVAAALLHSSVKADGTITEDEEIFLQFNAKVNLADKVKLLDADGNTVAGEWVSVRGGTKWKFIPAVDALSVDASYKIVLDSFTDERGQTVGGTEASFTYAEGEKAPEIIYNSSVSGAIVEDTYVASNSATAMEAEYSTSKDTLGTYSEYYRAYFKFNFKNILTNADFQTHKDSGKIQISFAIAKGAENLINTTKFTFGGFAAGEGTTDVAFSEVIWKNLKVGGTHDALNWGSATNMLASQSIASAPDSISYYRGILTFTFDYSTIADMIDSNTGYAVFVLRVVGTSGISIASMENKTYAAPAVSFVYNK